jgi:hypothetical protein
MLIRKCKNPEINDNNINTVNNLSGVYLHDYICVYTCAYTYINIYIYPCIYLHT